MQRWNWSQLKSLVLPVRQFYFPMAAQDVVYDRSLSVQRLVPPVISHYEKVWNFEKYEHLVSETKSSIIATRKTAVIQ